MLQHHSKIIIFIVSLSIYLNINSSLSARFIGTLLRAPLGAYGVAIGGAYTATVQDTSSMLWNPAGLSGINLKEEVTAKSTSTIEESEKYFQDFEEGDKELDPEYKKNLVETSIAKNIAQKRHIFQMEIYSAVTQLSLDRQLGFVGLGISTIKGALGLGVLGARVTDIEGYDALGQSTGQLKFSDIVIYNSYGIALKNFSFGFNTKILREELADTVLWGGALDLGVQFKVAILDIGLNIENLAGIMQQNTAKKLNRLDTLIHIVSSINIPITFFKIHLGLTSNVDEKIQEGLRFRAGMSFCWVKYYTCLLVGLNHNKFTGGISFNFENWVQISYAINEDILRRGIQHQLELHIKIRKK